MSWSPSTDANCHGGIYPGNCYSHIFFTKLFGANTLEALTYSELILNNILFAKNFLGLQHFWTQHFLDRKYF